MDLQRTLDLEARLIQFAVVCIQTAEQLPKTIAGNHLSGQLTRSGTAPALHYGEACSAESRTDFIHKMKIALKELRETNNCLAIIEKLNWELTRDLPATRKECSELVYIFLKSIDTARKNTTQKPLKSNPHS